MENVTKGMETGVEQAVSRLLDTDINIDTRPPAVKQLGSAISSGIGSIKSVAKLARGHEFDSMIGSWKGTTLESTTELGE